VRRLESDIGTAPAEHCDLTPRIGEQSREWVVEHRDWKSISIVAEAYAELSSDR
jgi:hypothetical protein